ncbi:MAG: hypothetical protein AAFR46_20545 [Pseudomonadota bacterium]
MIARLISPGLAAVALAAILLAYREIGILRGTPLWEFRFLALGVAGVALLSGLEWLAARLLRIFSPNS